MTSPRLSRSELAFIISVPAAWGILLLFHPTGDTTDFYPVIEDNVTAWITVHLGMGIFVPMFAGAVYLLLRGVSGTAATVSRIGLAVFAVLYAAWEITLGVGTGILANEVSALPAADHATGVNLVESYAESGVIVTLSVIGSVGLAMGVFGAVVALRRAHGVGWPALVLFLLAMPLIAVHEPPYGPIGLALFIAGALLLAREWAPAREPRAVRVGQAGPAPG